MISEYAHVIQKKNRIGLGAHSFSTKPVYQDKIRAFSACVVRDR